jgi:O-antigen ligase
MPNPKLQTPNSKKVPKHQTPNSKLLPAGDSRLTTGELTPQPNILYMVIVGLIWILVWGAFSSYGPGYVLSGNFLQSAFNFFNGIRAYFPFLAVFFALIIFAGKKGRAHLDFKKPTLYLILYAVVGLTATLLSPRGLDAIYWGLLYICVPLTGLLLTGYGESLEEAKFLLNTNWIIAFLFVFYLSVGPLRSYIIGNPLPQFYMFPGEVARITQNGVGRYAGVAVLIALSRFRQLSGKGNRVFWFFIFVFSLNLLSLSQSRSALLGFAGGAAVVLFSLHFNWIAFFAPIFAFVIYLSGFLWGSRGSLQQLFSLSGRLSGQWVPGFRLFEKSPFIGYGFHADRFMLEGTHMHNAFFHSLVQSGILGAIFFIAALYGIWFTVFKRNLIKKAADISKPDNIILSEALAIVLFFTLRSFFESTAAFYGADLFLIVPALLYINAYAEKMEKET